MNNFQEMGLSPMLTQALDKLGFTQPTSIQAKTVPLALQHKDILGSAQTGTGKTLAFALPLVNKLLNDSTSMGLILTPTRELAQQVTVSVNQLLGQNSSIKTALLIGGDGYAKQLSQLRSKVRIIIGTPGRIIDHLERGSFKTEAINFLVLDETDRMFDMGFSIQLEQIVSQLPTQRQTLMFSATFPPKIEKLAAKYMQHAERVFMNEFDSMAIVAQNLTQEVLEINEKDKYTELLTQLNNREGSILVFVKTKSDAEHLSARLNKEDYNTCAIHGNLRQNKRERVMRAFRQGRHQIMVATDIAARGLDVPHVKHVINYDIPHAPEDYVHRIGRTARAGAAGFAISFISSQDRRRWQAIQALLNPGQSKSESETSRKHSSRTSNSRPRSQGQRLSSQSRSRSRSQEGNVTSFRSRSERYGSRSQSRSQEGNGTFFQSRSERYDSRSQSRSQEGDGISARSRLERYDSRSQSRLQEGNGISSRTRSEGYGGRFQSRSQKENVISARSRSERYGSRPQSRSQERKDSSSGSHSQGYGISPQKGSQTTKFQKSANYPKRRA